MLILMPLPVPTTPAFQGLFRMALIRLLMWLCQNLYMVRRVRMEAYNWGIWETSTSLIPIPPYASSSRSRPADLKMSTSMAMGLSMPTLTTLFGLQLSR